MNNRPRSPLAAPALALALATFGSPSSASAQEPAPAPSQARPPEAFSHEPRNPLETWEVVDYLMKVGQPEQAAPYVKKFLDANPDDATLLRVRDEYGSGSVLRLSDELATRPYARPMADRLAAASARAATDPARMARTIDALTLTAEEQDVALERLREAGPYAVPPMLAALTLPGRSPEQRALIARNLGRLDRKAVPALIATLDAPDATLVGDAARALGQIGDRRAIPALTYLAARRNPESPAREQAAEAIRQITGNSFDSQPKAPVRVLAEEARRYQARAVRFPGDPVVLWDWDPAANAPVPHSYSVRDAEAALGLRAARQALAIEPTDVDAQATLVALALDHDPVGSRASALAAGADILSRVVRTAIADGRDALAVSAIGVLGEVTDREALTATDSRPNPLVEALAAPDRRVQLAAAAALVRLDPRRPFAGSSRLVPAVARFVASGQTPRAVVIDGNPTRASEIISPLRALGYDAQLAETGARGFAIAANSADVELVVIDPHAVGDRWDFATTLNNLRTDPRTAGIPAFLSGPLDARNQVAGRLDSFPDVEFLVTPAEPATLKGQIDRAFARLRARPLTPEERAGYAKRAAALLAQVARRPGSPFEPDLAAAEPALARALIGEPAAAEAAQALGDIPGAAAQASLATAALDGSRPLPLRVTAAEQLARNVRRFGPKLVGDQERALVDAFAREADPGLRDALAAVIGTLRPGPDASGTRLQTFRAPSSE